MKLYSDVITIDQMLDAIADVKHIAPSIGIHEHASRKGRKRAHSHDIYLEGWGAHHTRQSNFGRDTRAATWMDWGWFLAVLFRYDPNMVAAHYDGRDSFHDITTRDVRQRIARDRSVKNFARDYAAIWPNTHTNPHAWMVTPFAKVDQVCPPVKLALPWTPEGIDNFLKPWPLPRVEAFLAS